MRTTFQSDSYAMDEPKLRGWSKARVVKHALSETLRFASISMGMDMERGEMDVPANIRVEVFDQDDYHVHVRLHLEGGEDVNRS